LWPAYYISLHGPQVTGAIGWGLYGGRAGLEAYARLVLNATAQQEWVAGQLAALVDGADGVNWDLEGNEGVAALNFSEYGVNRTEDFAPGLTNLVRLMKQEGLKKNPRFQLSFCAPIYCNQTAWLAATDIKAMDEYVDFWIPMGYDMNGMGSPMTQGYDHGLLMIRARGRLARSLWGWPVWG
jgi:hypothetical protein